MQRIDKEENNSKCNVCSQGLSLIDHYLFGNRCLFCTTSNNRIGLLDYLICAYFDWNIYKELSKYKNKQNNRIILVACLGVLGLVDINQANTIKLKKELLYQIKSGNWNKF